MTEHNEFHEIPPIPVDLYAELDSLRQRTAELKADTARTLARYERIDPNAVAADRIGPPLSHEEALAAITARTRTATAWLGDAESAIGRALEPASRLMLTGEAAERREQLLDAQQCDNPEPSPRPQRRGITRDR